MEDKCRGEHRFFALDPVGIEDMGQILVVLVCTSCGEPKELRIQVAKPGTPIEQ